MVGRHHVAEALQISPFDVPFVARMHRVRYRGSTKLDGGMYRFTPNSYHPDDVRQLADDLASGAVPREDLLPTWKDDLPPKVALHVFALVFLVVSLWVLL